MRQLERVRVREATFRDLPHLVEAWGELARYHEQLDPGFALSRGWRQSYAAYVASLLGREDVCVVVAWAPGELAGMAVARMMLAPAFFRYRRRGYIQDVYTREPYRRQGIARRMVERLEAWLRTQGIRRVELTVALQNPTALAFWEDLGYRPYLQTFGKAL